MTKLSYQLYSSRNFPPLDDTLKLVAETGYAQAECYSGLFQSFDDIGALKAKLDAAGLDMPTTHVGLDMIEDDPQGFLKIAGQLGITHAFVPHLAEDLRPDSADGWRAFGAQLEEAGKPLEDAGVRFGWHNHDFEYIAGASRHPIDDILAGGPNLAFEFDVAWAVRAGADPMETIARYGDRILAAHVKDIAPAGECLDEDGWADVGHGSMDWAGLMTALKGTNCKYFVMEHDNPNDDKRFARRSFEFINSL
ncbi:MAG: TIM barrel protein [Boseongicola sp.]|nr:MAG: TIM barrel protein [Boseongicola sp.]